MTAPKPKHKPAFDRKRRLKRPTKVTPARWAAWMVVQRTFDEGAWTDRAFTGVIDNLGLDGRERAFAQRLAYGTVQQAKRLDFVIASLGKRPLTKLDPPVLHALRVGMYELLELRAESSAHAAVDQAVELVRGVVGERAVAFTNAILRRAQVDAVGLLATLDPAKDADLATLLSMPEWLVTRVRADHGDDGIEALRAQNEPRDGTTFRLNGAMPELAHEILWTPADGLPGALRVEGSTGPLAELVEAGVLVPQSRASQLVVAALDPLPGERVLDMCAAPGGKTTDIAARVGPSGSVAAVELHEHRADSVRALAERTGVADRVIVHVADATELVPGDIGLFDRVLLDAPCTGTGVLGARPDSRWKRTEEGVDELVELQRQLLATAATLVRPGGVVVYSTCSILRAEDEAIADAAPDELEPSPIEGVPDELLLDGGTRMRTWPHRDATEGFFVARFVRRTPDQPGGAA